MNKQAKAPAVIFPAEHVGQVDVSSGHLEIGDLVVNGVGHGYPMGNVYVRKMTGKIDGLAVAHVIIEIIGDRHAQEELDEENYWAERGMCRQYFVDNDENAPQH